MKKPRVIIFSGYGLHTEDETKAAFESVGAEADIVHLNDLIKRPAMLTRYQIVCIGGGFAYGDHTGGGKAYGNRVRNHLGGALEKFLARDTLMIGICNGFQILTAAGFLPGALMANDFPRYNCRWVDLSAGGGSASGGKVSPWLKGISKISMPIAHGEGKYYLPAAEISALQKAGGVALKYAEGEIAKNFDLPANPNGSIEDIAGVTAREGRILGLMPHPERAVRFTQLPHWTLLNERYLRDGEPLPTEGPGLQIFRNAVQYFHEK